MSTDEEYLEVWGDRVSLRDMVLALVVCGSATALAVVIGRALGSSEFFWGLGGSVVGFVVAVALVRPKRDVQIVDADDPAPADLAPTAPAAPGALSPTDLVRPTDPTATSEPRAPAPPTRPAGTPTA